MTTKISELPAGTVPLTGSESVVALQGGQTVRLPTSALIGPAGAAGPVGPAGAQGPAGSLNAVGVTIEPSNTYEGTVFTDPNGNKRAEFSSDGSTVFMAGLIVQSEVTTGDVNVSTIHGGTVRFSPAVGVGADTLTSTTGMLFGVGTSLHSAFYVDPNGRLVGRFDDVEDTGGFTADDLTRWDAWAAAKSYEFENTPHDFQIPESAGFNHFMMLGESFAAAQSGVTLPTYLTGQVSLPAAQVLMIGQSEHGQAENLGSWTPIGGTAVTALRGTVVELLGDPAATRTVLTSAQVSALGQAPSNRGESAGVAALYTMKLLGGVNGDFVLTNGGRSGALIETWLPGAQQVTGSDVPTGIYLYPRVDSMVSVVVAAASVVGKPYRAAAVIWDLGRNNYSEMSAGRRPQIFLDGDTERVFSAQTKVDMLARLREFRSAVIEDTLKVRSGQTRVTPWFVFQPGERYTVDGANLGIGEATIAWAEEDEGVILVGSEDDATDINHLDFNGYRWKGCKLGQVMQIVLGQGKRWKAPSPWRILQKGPRQILVVCHVPVPPLTVRPAYRRINYEAFLDTYLGFRVYQNGVEASIASVSYPEGTERLILIEMAEDLTVAPTVVYKPSATETVDGNGNVFDSDSTTAYFSYVYDGGINMVPEANVTALVGQPYPMNNPMVAFYRVAEVV